jgi:hypothetical protein
MCWLVVSAPLAADCLQPALILQCRLCGSVSENQGLSRQCRGASATHVHGHTVLGEAGETTNEESTCGPSDVGKPVCEAAGLPCPAGYHGGGVATR